MVAGKVSLLSLHQRAFLFSTHHAHGGTFLPTLTKRIRDSCRICAVPSWPMREKERERKIDREREREAEKTREQGPRAQPSPQRDRSANPDFRKPSNFGGGRDERGEGSGDASEEGPRAQPSRQIPYHLLSSILFYLVICRLSAFFMRFLHEFTCDFGVGRHCSMHTPHRIGPHALGLGPPGWLQLR